MESRTHGMWTALRENESRRLHTLLQGCAVVSLLSHLIHPPLFFSIPLALLAVAVLPGMALLLFFQGRSASLSRLAAQSLLISPVLTTMWLFLLNFTGISFPHSLLLLRGATLVFLIASMNRCRLSLTWHRKRAPLLAGALFLLLLLLALPPLLNIHLRAYYNAFKDMAIMKSIFLTGMAPADPFFAGEKSIYYWWFHAYAGAIHKLSGLDPLTSFMVVNLLAMISLFSALQMMARKIFRTVREKSFAVLLGLFGLNIPGALLLLYNGSEALEVLRRGGPNLLVDFLNLTTAGWDIRTASPLAKFYNVNSAPICCALFVGLLDGIIGIIRGQGRKGGAKIQIFFCLAGLLHFQVLGGFFALAGISGGILLTAFIRRGGLLVLGKRLAIPLALGFLSALPYLYSIYSSHWQKNAVLSFSTDKLSLLLGPFLLLLPFLYYTAQQWRREKKTEKIFFLFFLFCGFLFYLPFTFPVNNQYKLLLFLSFPAGLACAGSVVRLLKAVPQASRSAFQAGLILLILSTSLATVFLHFYFALTFGKDLDKNVLAFAIKGNEVVFADPEEDLAKAAAFVRSSTPEKSVFIDRLRYDFLSLCGRAAFLSNPDYLVEGRPDYALRKAIVDGIYKAEKKPHKETVPSLKSLGKPVFFVFRRGDGGGRKVLLEKLSSLAFRFEPVFQSPGVSVVEITFPEE